MSDLRCIIALDAGAMGALKGLVDTADNRETAASIPSARRAINLVCRAAVADPVDTYSPSHILIGVGIALGRLTDEIRGNPEDE